MITRKKKNEKQKKKREEEREWSTSICCVSTCRECLVLFMRVGNNQCTEYCWIQCEIFRRRRKMWVMTWYAGMCSNNLNTSQNEQLNWSQFIKTNFFFLFSLKQNYVPFFLCFIFLAIKLNKGESTRFSIQL